MRQRQGLVVLQCFQKGLKSKVATAGSLQHDSPAGQLATRGCYQDVLTYLMALT